MKFRAIEGNRGFFPGHLASTGRERMIAALTLTGHDAVCLTPEQSRHGAVPAASNTVRKSEKLPKSRGSAGEPLDLSEVFGRIERLKDEDPGVRAKLQSIEQYVSTEGVPAVALTKMAKLGLVIDRWMT